MVAGFAGRDKIIPRVGSAAGAGDDVVDGEIAGFATAVLAGEAVADEDLAPGQFHAGAWAADQVDQPDDRGRGEATRGGRDDRVVGFENFGFAVDELS